jgi:hypothetical protein
MEPVDDRWKDGIILGSLFLVRDFRFVPGLSGAEFGRRIEIERTSRLSWHLFIKCRRHRV